MSNPDEQWYDITYPSEGRAKPVGIADEGELKHWIVERADGDLELLDPEESQEISFSDDRQREDATMPVRELHDEIVGNVYDAWAGREEEPVTLVWEPRAMAIRSIEFDNGLPLELVDELGLVDRDRGDAE